MNITTNVTIYPANAVIRIYGSASYWVSYDVDTDLSTTFDLYEDADELFTSCINDTDWIIAAIDESDLSQEEKQEAYTVINDLLAEAYHHVKCDAQDYFNWSNK